MTIRHDPRRRLLTAAVCAALLLGAGRVAAVRPISGGDSPADVLHRLETAVATRNPQDYADCLADSFTFVPYAAVPIAYPDLPWKSWGKARELEFIDWLCSPARSAELDLTERVISPGPEFIRYAQWDVIYTITAPGGVYRGRAILDFERIRHNWYLSGWMDTAPENVDGRLAATSGDLRAIALR